MLVCSARASGFLKRNIWGLMIVTQLRLGVPHQRNIYFFKWESFYSS